ncbi:MAG TPA: hypothetical protein VN947_16495 [Polyangia bacterium]|nr:hypothetical protein [Polyangia bacterium]
MNIPPDLNDPNDPNAQNPGGAPPGLDDFALKKSGSKTPWIVVGVIAVAAIGFFVYRSMQTQKIREMHVAVMNQFQQIEKDQVVGKFWACLLGAGVDPGMFPNNLALSQRLEGAFGTDPKNYPTKVREECTPKAIDAKHSIEGMTAPAMYDQALKAYAKSLQDLSTAFDEWAKVAPSHLAEREVGQKVGTDGAAWHSFAGGKPGADVVAYDRFLHCAVPGVDKMRDGQALVEYLFKECKDPKYLDTLQNTCGKEVTTENALAAPTPGFKTAVAKLAADDRELSAFDDCLRKSRKSKRGDDAAEVGKAWVEYMEAGHKVREVGKEALADK